MTQVIRFLLSGGVATFIHWAVIGLFVWLGEQPTFATAIGALAGSTFNYLFQFYWTFGGRSEHSRTIPVYACSTIVGWGVNVGLFYFLISVIYAGVAWAQILTTAIVAAINFILYKRIVFNERIIR